MLLAHVLLSSFTLVRSQYSITATTLNDRTVAEWGGTVLLLVKDAPLADGWLMMDARLTDQGLTGRMRRAHPLAVAQLESRHRKKKDNPELYDLPQRALLIHVSDTCTTNAVPDREFTVPRSEIQDCKRLVQRTDGRQH